MWGGVRNSDWSVLRHPLTLLRRLIADMPSSTLMKIVRNPVPDFPCKVQPCVLLADWPVQQFWWTAQVEWPATAQSTWTSLQQTWTFPGVCAWRL